MFDPILTPRDIQRFQDSVDHSGGADACWEWKRGRYTAGYGAFAVSGKSLVASRVAYFLANGRFSDDLFVCHACDFPPCCNPRHLFLGDNKINMSDAAKKGRMSSGDRHYAKLHPERLARGDRCGARTHPECLARGERNGARLHPGRMPRGEKNGARLHPERVPRGSRNGMARLTEALIQDILVGLKAGTTGASLARRHNVSVSTISLIKRGKIWKHCLVFSTADAET